MASMREIPEQFRHRPFHHEEFRAAGFSEKVLRGRRFVRFLPRVWVHVDHEMSESDRIAAARLALPADARLTGVSRLRELGLDVGESIPAHFVVARELHLELDGIVLHRTDRLPPCDSGGVRPVAAFVEFCRTATVLEAICVGDWLLHRGHMSLTELGELVRRDDWRAGSAQTTWVGRYLHPGARSWPESATRSWLVFAGLPWPEVNLEIRIEGLVVAVGDLGYRDWRCLVEYEGGHHQAARSQYLRDIDRYAIFRGHQIAYHQVTAEAARVPVQVVAAVYRMLVAQGYDGPPPAFDRTWRLLHRRIPSRGPGPVSRPAAHPRPWAVA